MIENIIFFLVVKVKIVLDFIYIFIINVVLNVFVCLWKFYCINWDIRFMIYNWIYFIII